MIKRYLLILIIVGILSLTAYFVLSDPGQENKEKNETLPAKLNTNNTIKKDKQPAQAEFDGEKGEAIFFVNGQIILESKAFVDTSARYYNVELPSGKIIYFFVLKDKLGVYRAAANACQVCFGARMGFRQEGDFMVCNTCGNKYPLEKIATEKGGCNPGPINPNLKVENGKIIIKQLELEQVSDLF